MNIEEYIGIPYVPGGRSINGGDCWNLVLQFYFRELHIQLPDWFGEIPIDMDDNRCWTTSLDEPLDFCLVREKRSGVLPDHWGIYYNGGVISSESPASNYVPLDRYLERHPEAVYYAVVIPEEGKQ